MSGLNRKQRRAAAARNRKRHNSFYQSYIRHLPQVPLDAPFERGRVYHLVHFHDDWCRFYDTSNPADCNCGVVLARFKEPVRC